MDGTEIAIRVAEFTFLLMPFVLGVWFTIILLLDRD